MCVWSRSWLNVHSTCLLALSYSKNVNDLSNKLIHGWFIVVRYLSLALSYLTLVIRTGQHLMG